MSADGAVYVADQNRHVIFRVTDGIEVVIADVGGVQTNDGKPANQTRVHGPGDVVVAGETFYFMDGEDLRALEPL